MKVEPILAVMDVVESSKWYQSVFDCRSMHGGDQFDVLVSEENEIFICLHKWGEHEHPTMKNPNITPGNGIILYFRTENMAKVRQKLEKMNYAVVSDIELNPNSQKKEFSVIDPNGYYLTISDFHRFEV